MSGGLIGVPTTDTARHSAFYEQVLLMKRPPDTLMQFIRGASVSENRNRVLQTAKERKAPWVFFLDDDMIPPAETLTQLLARPVVPVLSALYISRITPFIPMAFQKAEPNGSVWKCPLGPEDKGVREVAAVGAGAMLVRPIVWETLPAPWFTLGQIKADTWGDDLHFCKKVRDAGLGVYCDYDIGVGHLGVIGAWPSYTVNTDGSREWHTDLVQNAVRMRQMAANDADIAAMPNRSGD